MKHEWTVSVGQGVTTLHVYDLDARARFRIAVESLAGRLCTATGGRLFGHGLGDWAWRVPLGMPAWDRTDPADPWLENSVAGKLFDVEQAICRWSWRAQDRCQVAAVPIDTDVARRLWGGDAYWFDEFAPDAA